jgi:uncharacterized protein (TIGR03435 family)
VRGIRDVPHHVEFVLWSFVWLVGKMLRLRSVPYGVGIALLTASVAFGQVPSAAAPTATPLAFEVATIKPTDPAFGGIVMRLGGGRFSATGFTLKDLVAFAYEVDNSQIVSGPNWFASDRFDILGKPEKEGPLNRDDARVMLRTLLAERFRLKIHRETREMPVYVLTVGKNGSKMKPRMAGDGGESTRLTFQGTKATGRRVSAKVLAEELQAMALDRPVLDKTGLTGDFDFNLSWRPGDSAAGDPNDPDIFTAVQEQLGLKLEPQRAQAEAIIVAAAERPSGN